MASWQGRAVPRLKRAQYWILDALLAHAPVHAAAHGFVPGRSILTNAGAHVGRDVVVNLDLENFFPAGERFQLASRLNTVAATPGFDAWLGGEPLDLGSLLWTQGLFLLGYFLGQHLPLWAILLGLLLLGGIGLLLSRRPYSAG